MHRIFSTDGILDGWNDLHLVDCCISRIRVGTILIIYYLNFLLVSEVPNVGFEWWTFEAGHTWQDPCLPRV